MPLEPQTQKILQPLKELNSLIPIPTLSPPEVREKLALISSFSLQPQKCDRVENLTIPSPSGNIPIRIYTPTGKTPLPVLVYFHGGGWVLGNLDSADYACRCLANDGKCIVVSVDYRLAPEHKFPAAIEDAYTAITWVSDNAETIGGDPDRIGVIGDSSGGNLAAGVSLMAQDKQTPSLAIQILIYPVTHYNFMTQSYQQFGSGEFGLSTDEMIWFWHHYLLDKTDGKKHYASPLLAENLSQLPPAFIITAEYDILRDEAESYAHRLQQAGVSVNLKRYEGTIHNFVGLASILNIGKQALSDINSHLRNVFW